MDFPWLALVFIAIIGLTIIYFAARADFRQDTIKTLDMPGKTRCNPPYNWQKLFHSATQIPVILATKDFPSYHDKDLGENAWWLGVNIELFILNQEITNERLWLTFAKEAKANKNPIAIIAPTWKPEILDLCLANARIGSCIILPLIPQSDLQTSSLDTNATRLSDAIIEIANRLEIQITNFQDLAAGYLPSPKDLRFLSASSTAPTHIVD